MGKYSDVARQDWGGGSFRPASDGENDQKGCLSNSEKMSSDVGGDVMKAPASLVGPVVRRWPESLKRYQSCWLVRIVLLLARHRRNNDTQ